MGFRDRPMSRQKSDKRMIVCVCGMAGSGKSTLARKLAKKYGLKYSSGGDALKAVAIDEGYRHMRQGWWESEEGMRFLQERRKNLKLDRAVDEKLLELARQGNVVLDSWTMPWVLKEGFKIWLETSLEKRAERIAERDNISFEEALTALRSKEKQTKAIYKKLYGFDLGDDFAPFKLVLDTDNLEASEVFQILCKVLDNVVLNENSG